ncbi:hypothetical protein MA16_Dca003788 [Dendrobium catenatum]|uniref:Uncharacterized protein n=1 Tax=Dendrobium catenatum TaxID=906689 RepID=A0A2I0WFY9_9ASPA|nr:hypothetical protein MA16_Dca003788 [Dendrobium catenatum]
MRSPPRSGRGGGEGSVEGGGRERRRSGVGSGGGRKGNDVNSPIKVGGGKHSGKGAGKPSGDGGIAATRGGKTVEEAAAGFGLADMMQTEEMQSSANAVFEDAAMEFELVLERVSAAASAEAAAAARKAAMYSAPGLRAEEPVEGGVDMDSTWGMPRDGLSRNLQLGGADGPNKVGGKGATSSKAGGEELPGSSKGAKATGGVAGSNQGAARAGGLLPKATREASRVAAGLKIPGREAELHIKANPTFEEKDTAMEFEQAMERVMRAATAEAAAAARKCAVNLPSSMETLGYMAGAADSADDMNQGMEDCPDSFAEQLQVGMGDVEMNAGSDVPTLNGNMPLAAGVDLPDRNGGGMQHEEMHPQGVCGNASKEAAGRIFGPAVPAPKQGARKKATGNYLRHLVGDNDVHFIGLVETKIETLARADVDKLIGVGWNYFHFPSSGKSGGILVLWRKDITTFDVLDAHDQVVVRAREQEWRLIKAVDESFYYGCLGRYRVTD